MIRVTVNIVSFQLAWWACVLSARADAAWIGLCVTAAVLVLHLAISPIRGFEVWFIPLAAAIGYAADTVAALAQALEFNLPTTRVLPAPPWIAALWVAFATTLNTSFSWMRDRVILAGVVGAASGPLAYAAGAALGVVSLPRPVFSVITLSILWGVTLPILVLIAAWGRRWHRSAGMVRQQCAGDAV